MYKRQADIPAEYRAYIEDMQASFALLDERIAEINSMTEDGESLDAIRAVSYTHLDVYKRQAMVRPLTHLPPLILASS